MLENCSAPLTPAEKQKLTNLARRFDKFSIENYLWCSNEDLQALIKNRGYKITMNAAGSLIEIRSLSNNMYLKTSGKVLMIISNNEVQYISPGEEYDENELIKIYKSL